MKAKKLTPKELIHVIATGIHDDELLPRFLPKFVQTEDGCWQWIAGVTSRSSRSKYGAFQIAGHRMLAHRVSYALLKGDIPDELELDHLCRNTLCINPDHLEAVTASTNVRRGTGPSALNAVKTECPKGHPFSEENTWTDRRGARHCRECDRNKSRRRSGLRVSCPECGKEMRFGSLWTHRRNIHEVLGADTFEDAQNA